MPFTPTTINYAHAIFVAVYEVHSTKITFGTVTCMYQHSVIGVVTCYSLDSPGIESWWG